MIEATHPDALNTRNRPWRRRIAQGLGVTGLIAVGIVFGAKLWQPIQSVEQRVTTPIRDVVKRASPLEQLPDSAAAACPAIVSLRVPGLQGPAPQGVLISGNGLVVTSAAVPAGLTFDAWLDGRKLQGKVEAQDPLTGISLVKLDGIDLPSLALGDPDIAPPGSWGFTLASPNGSGCIVEQATVASDFATDGATQDYYLRIHGTGDAPPDGTPFLGADGRVVALAQAGLGDGGRPDRFLPADLVTITISRLMRTADVAPPPFGLVAEDLSPILAARLGADRGRGAVVVHVAKGSIAEASRLRIGDVILSAGRTPISSASELARVLGGSDPVEMIVSRGRDRAQLVFTLTP
ncbi:S1C family serine protease [Sphingomonas sp. BIUV-7]|uniref:S1C family serine protease n=1 Tax=Sphingomonas natans TaxID=3063330 RepID=A0ABT8Y3K1_9SPHN|nr:S1C family serine protease [Sphingomonas sp. BIUV-7]MDO6412880.1 S1C family serine protease [Sphingomonas sp. BIUV-7]